MSNYRVIVKQDRWSRLSVRQQIWKFLNQNVSHAWTRFGNIFEFSDSQDAVIFSLYWS
jgi:hypothetical protein